MSQDKRRDRRLKFRGCSVRLVDPAGLDRYLSGEGRAPHPLVDLSRGGLQFASKTPFAVGERLRISLAVPQFSRPIELAARVAWCRMSADVHAHQVGVEFLAPSRKAERMLASLRDEGIRRELQRLRM
ncbi:MAG: PilZ domain-containing protein [Planctomycetes bacterium]|nr:PilZ domain-containing protein [Planctomycetota bacterium]